ncbi:MAG: dihydropyrimidinase [Calditrichaeota bacterium]|nr:dihydropyrimidinase [Calditrichota bacterium]
MESLLIKQGQIVTESHVFTGDLLIVDGRIQAVGENLEKWDAGTRVLDASGLQIFPGGIDPHVHMELPVSGTISSDDFASGTAAALAGGTTTIIDFVTPGRNQSLIEALRERQELAKKSLCDYGLHMSVTGWNDFTQKEMQRCVEKEGIPSFKVYLAYKETIGLEDRDLIRVMDTAARLKALITAHCEHGDAVTYLQEKLLAEGKTEPKYHALSRPPELEREAVVRALTLAHVTGVSLYVVHVSTKDAAEEIAAARKRGQPVYGETCPHYLLLDETAYNRTPREAAAYIMSPPLRPPEHKEALWQALKEDALQTVGTDHCPFNLKGQKDRDLSDFTKIPNGIGGVENRLQLLYTYGVLAGKISLNQFVAITATNPAKIFGLYPRKGTLAVGSDADLVLWNPEGEDVISAKTHHHHCDSTVYEGFKIQGKPEFVLANGRVVVADGEVLARSGDGRFLERKKVGLVQHVFHLE